MGDNLNPVTFNGVSMVDGFLEAHSYLFSRQTLDYSSYQGSFESIRKEVLRILDNDIRHAGNVSPVLKSMLLSFKHLIYSDSMSDDINALHQSGLSISDAIDEYFSLVILMLSEHGQLDRQNDIRDIYTRFQKVMNIEVRVPVICNNDIIIVAEDITVSDFLYFPLSRVKAIITTNGHRTSHAVELAINLDLPMVIQATAEIIKIDHPALLSISQGTISLI
mgnify:CR=1 FL=1